jgi:hypothetical protein
VIGVNGKGERPITYSEFMKRCLLAVAQDLFTWKYRILQDIKPLGLEKINIQLKVFWTIIRTSSRN